MAAATAVLVGVSPKFVNDETKITQEMKIMNWINIAATVLSIGLFVLTRFKFIREIRKSSEITAAEYCQETVTTSLVFIGCLVRWVQYSLSLFEWNVNMTWGHYNDSCLDDQVWHAIYLLSITVIAYMLPPIIFGLTFNSRLGSSRIESDFDSFDGGSSGVGSFLLRIGQSPPD